MKAKELFFRNQLPKKISRNRSLFDVIDLDCISKNVDVVSIGATRKKCRQAYWRG